LAASATIQVVGQITGLAGGSEVLSASLTSALANGTRTLTVLQAGVNTVTVPTAPAPTGVLIILPPTNTSVVTLKGVGGDTGIAIGKTGFLLLTWDAAAVPASFVLNSVSTQTGLYTEMIFF
jgi:hypothetical protein